MIHEFTELKIENGWLCLKPSDLFQARREIREIKQGEAYQADISKLKRKRSLDANSYFWVLVSKLSGTLAITKEEIYKDLIKNIGDNFDLIPIRQDAVDRFVLTWQSRGIGWVCECTGSSEFEGYQNVMAYYGSSVYDTKQMNRLIDLIVQECKQQGIETIPPEELKRMIGEWKK